MDPLHVPLWKFLCRGLHNNWLRRIAHGHKTYVIPFDNIGTTVFVAELVSQLRSRNTDLDRLAAYRSRNEGTNLQQKEATQQMAKDIAQQVQSWLPSTTVADPTSQQRILELETELAKAKAPQGDASAPPDPPGTSSTPGMAPILQGRPTTTLNHLPSSSSPSPSTHGSKENQPAFLSLTPTTRESSKNAG